MNHQLLFDIADAIEAYPDKFNMSVFVSSSGEGFRGDWGTPQTAESFHNCDSTACVAGWAAVLSHDTNLWDVGQDRGMKLLDLTEHEADRLFYCGQGTIWFELADEYGWDRVHLNAENWDCVTAYQASDVLRRIAKEDVFL